VTKAGEAAVEQALELTRKAAVLFAERGFENPRLEAELLLAAVLDVKRLDLYLQHDRPVTAAELESFRGFVRRRLRHEPLQYVTGRASFRHLELQVDARVLVPRPETEGLVGAVLDWAAARDGATSVLDVGTGSGAVALSLATEGTFTRVVASDNSDAALEVARRNAMLTGVEGGVEFRLGSLFDVVRVGETFTVIASNPPYIAEHERDLLAPEVKDYEPAGALFGGADGLSVIRELVTQAPRHLEPGGLLAIEIGAGQADAVLACAAQTGAYTGSSVRSDLAGRQRVVMMECPTQQRQEREKSG
jgi:release factor glutamine methyltransferase